MKIKEGTLCYISMPGNGGIIQPIFGETGKSFFSADQEVKVSDINCDEIKTVVWINKHHFLKD